MLETHPCRVIRSSFQARRDDAYSTFGRLRAPVLVLKSIHAIHSRREQSGAEAEKGTTSGALVVVMVSVESMVSIPVVVCNGNGSGSGSSSNVVM